MPLIEGVVFSSRHFVRNAQKDLGSDIGLAPYIKGPAEKIGQPAGNRQSQPHSGKFPPQRAIHLLKRLEHILDLVARNSYACIYNLQINHSPVNGSVYLHGDLPFGSKLDGIMQKIPKDPAYLTWIAHHTDLRSRRLNRQVNPFFLQPFLVTIYTFLYHRLDIEFFLGYRDVAGI